MGSLEQTLGWSGLRNEGEEMEPASIGSRYRCSGREAVRNRRGLPLH